MIEGMTGRTWERQSLRCGYNYNNQYSEEMEVLAGRWEWELGLDSRIDVVKVSIITAVEMWAWR